MALRGWVLAGLLVVLFATACESAPRADRAEPTPTATAEATATPARTPDPEWESTEAEKVVASVFEGVRGYEFTDAGTATERRLGGIFRRNAPAPILGLTVQRVHQGGRLIPAMVLVAIFDVPKDGFSDFFTELFVDIEQDFDAVEPTLGGLGAHFTREGLEAVAYPGPHGELVYVVSPQPGLALPLAKALVAAERS